MADGDHPDDLKVLRDPEQVAPDHLPVPQNIGKLHERMMMVTTLTDGGQQPVEIARALHDFLADAHTSLDLALYDFKLQPGTEELVVDTIEEVARRGVAVRIAYNADYRAPIPVSRPLPSRRPRTSSG